MKKPVIVRFRQDTETMSGARNAEGEEIELPNPAVADLLYGNAVEIVGYADGEPYSEPVAAEPVKAKKG